MLADSGTYRIAWLGCAVLLLVAGRRATAAFLIATVVLYLRYVSNADAPYPAIDWIRMRGMDLWPGLLQTLGMLLVLGAGAGVLARPLRPLLAALVLGTVLSGGWWFFPGHFNLDVLGPASQSGTPAVVSGRIENRQWRREVLPARPLDAWNRVIQGEQTLSGIGHGVGQRTNRTHGVVRATLWAVQRGALVTYAWMTAVGSAVGGLVLVCAALPARWRAIGWWGLRLLTFSLVLPPVASLSIRALGLALGLPEASVGAPLAFMQCSATLLVVGLSAHAARRWSR